MRSKKIFPILILIPFLILFITFRLIPIIYTGFRSIFDFKNGVWNYNAFESYSRVFSDTNFYWAILNTIIIYCIYILIKIPLVVLAALLLSSIGKSQKIYMKLMYLPLLVGMFAYGIIFRYMFTYDGIINSILNGIFGCKVDWLGNSFAAQNVVVIAMLWGSFGINVLMVSNVINQIPKERFDYAKIEGSSAFRNLFKIILPVLKPIIFTLLMLSLIETIGLIDVPMNLTQGGPNSSTITLGYYIYKLAFEYTNFSAASTVSVVMFSIIIIPLTIYSLRTERKERKHA